MTLQERILEAIGERTVLPATLYRTLSGENAAAVEAALTSLLKSARITFELGRYERNRSVQPQARAKTPGAWPVVPIRPTTAAVEVHRPAPADCLTNREREIYELAQGGMPREKIAEKLGLSRGTVDVYMCTARRKLGIKVRVAGAGDAPLKSAPSAAVPLTAVPSPESAETATVGAEPPSIATAKEEEATPALCRITFSPDLILRLVELQRSKVMRVEVLREKLAMEQQDLADIEQIVRIATAKESA